MRLRSLSLSFFALAIFILGSASPQTSQAQNACRQVHNSTTRTETSTFQVEDVVPHSFYDLERSRVYAVRLKDGSKKVIRFSTAFGIQFEAFASTFFQSYSTTMTSKVRKFSAKETIQLLEKLKTNDPHAYQNIKINHGPRNLLASGTEFHEAKVGSDYLKSKGLDLDEIIFGDGDMNRIVNEFIIHAQPPRLSLKIQSQLADYWATALVLQILDIHPNNWMIKGGKVIAIDLAYPYEPQDMRQKATEHLHFRHVNNPFSLTNVTSEMRTHLIGMISQEQLGLFQQLDAGTIQDMAIQAGLKISSQQIQGIMDRAGEILRLRGL